MGIALFNFEQERSIISLFQLSSTVALHEFCGSSKWMLGLPESGLKHVQEAIDLAEKLEHPPSIAFAYGIGCTEDLRQAYTLIEELRESPGQSKLKV